MNDSDLIEAIARLWIKNGGDAEGIAWCWQRIQTRVAELQSGDYEPMPKKPLDAKE